MANLEVTIENCNSIDTAAILVTEGCLNIKYGPNGIGKSTIAKAIVGQARQDGSLECPLRASRGHALWRCQTLPNPALFLILSATHARLAPLPVSRDRGLCTGAARLGLVTLLQSFRALIGLCWCCLRSNRPARAHGVPPLRPSGLGYIPHAAARH